MSSDGVTWVELPSVLWCCWLGGRKGIWPVKKYGGWWRWELVSPDGVAPSRTVIVSASVNLPLHHKVQKFSSGTGPPGWSRKKDCKMVVVVVVVMVWDANSETDGVLLVCWYQVLELQQNLAVAVSTDRKKDVMIEQLDRVTQLIRIYIYKGIGNCAISSTAANRIVARHYTWTR